MSLLSHIVDKKISHLLLKNLARKSTMSEESFVPKKVLVLRKFSRLEYEKLCHPTLTEEQLANNVSICKQTSSLTITHKSLADIIN